MSKNGDPTKARAEVLSKECYDLTRAMAALERIRTKAHQDGQIKAWRLGYKACLRDNRLRG